MTYDYPVITPPTRYYSLCDIGIFTRLCDGYEF